MGRPHSRLVSPESLLVIKTNFLSLNLLRAKRSLSSQSGIFDNTGIACWVHTGCHGPDNIPVITH